MGEFVLVINDMMNVLNGKWKLLIIGFLFYGKKCFKELEREIFKIIFCMFFKELKDLEVNGIVICIVYDIIFVMVEYELIELGNIFNMVLDVMIVWGL